MGGVVILAGAHDAEAGQVVRALRQTKVLVRTFLAPLLAADVTASGTGQASGGGHGVTGNGGTTIWQPSGAKRTTDFRAGVAGQVDGSGVNLKNIAIWAISGT